MKNKTLKAGSLHWKQGYQTLQKVLQRAEDNDKIKMPSRIFELKEQAAIHNDVTIEGSKASIVLIPNADNPKESFNQQGFYIPGSNTVTIRQVILELEPETYGIDIPASFNGTLTLDQLTTRHKRRVLYADERMVYPSIRAHGSGTIRINRSTIDYIAIDAPNMVVYIEQSTIGTFDHNSLIRAKEIHLVDCTVNNCQVSAKNGVVTDLKTNGGIALQGSFKLTRTHLLPIEAARPELYPKAMTYVITLPGSKVIIKDILSKVAKKPPYYRHFDFRQSEVSLSGTEGLHDQVLDNVLIKSTVHVNGGNWLTDPSPEQQQQEQLKLTAAYQTQK